MFEKIGKTLSDFFATSAGAVVHALLLLALAFLAAAIAKWLITRLLKFPRIKGFMGRFDMADNPGGTVRFIGKLVYFIVFILFVPGILNALHADNVAQPILNLVNQVWNYLPNIIAAVIVLAVGFFAARLLRQLLIPVFRRIRVDALQEKAGVDVPDSARLSTTLAYIVYVLIIIPVIIVALKVLKIEAISEPAVAMLNKIFNAIPKILVACLLVGVGVVIARFAGQITEKLIASTGADARLRGAMGDTGAKFSLSRIVNVTLQALILIFFTVEAFNMLGFTVLKDIGATVIRYLPNVLAAVIIFVLAVILARLAENALKKTSLGTYAVPVKGVIFAAAGFMVLTQLGIASRIVTYAFIGVLGALAVAFAVAFGIGGREFAAQTLKKLSGRTESPAEGPADEPDEAGKE